MKKKPKKKSHIPNMDFDEIQKKYRISLASKVETIQNIVPSISNFKALEKSLSAQDIEDIKKLFNYE